MKLLVAIDAPDWEEPSGGVRGEQGRKHQMSAALKSIAEQIANCGAMEGSIERDELHGRFEIAYAEKV